MVRRNLVLIAVTLLIAVAASAEAQPRFGRGPQPRAGACFFQDSNFRGDYFCIDVGGDVRQMPREMNDRISSIRLIGNADVIVFRDSRFRGESARFGTNVRNLHQEGWNDLISSIRVTGGGFGGGNPPILPPGAPMPPAGACFYTEANFRGERFCIERGVSYERLPPGFNDRVSSIQVRRAVVMLFENRDFDGRSARVARDVRDMRGVWNDRLSSVRVY